MLVITRKIGQAFMMLDGAIEVRILNVQGTTVRVGIEAPKHIDIVREELIGKPRKV